MWADRVEAGRRLAEELVKYKGSGAIVLGIPRGGVVVAAQIAGSLGLRLDIVLAKKIGSPYNPEVAIGAVAEDGSIRVDERFASAVGATQAYIDSEAKSLSAKMKDQRALFVPGGKSLEPAGKTFIVADDGIATGATVLAAVDFLKRKGAKVVVAAPVCPPDTAEELRKAADETVLLETPVNFGAVGAFYADFTQVEDETVKEILRNSGAGKA